METEKAELEVVSPEETIVMIGIEPIGYIRKGAVMDLSGTMYSSVEALVEGTK